jgi:uncharacterized protein YjbI with pentapeptide repeats
MDDLETLLKRRFSIINITNIVGANLRRANLMGADLAKADLQLAN